MYGNKLSQTDPNMVTIVFAQIEDILIKMTMTREKHKFLGMEIIFNDFGTIQIGMK